MKTMATLLKREYWENRSNFVITPAVIGILLIVVMILTLFSAEFFAGTANIQVSGLEFLDITNGFENLSFEQRQDIWEKRFIAMSTLFTSIMVMVSVIYLLGALYDDRKDKSILFWKSLPVSDLMTVSSKILTVIFVIPALFIAALTLTYVALIVIASISVIYGGGSLWAVTLQPTLILIVLVPVKLYLSYVIQSLFAAPFLAWLLLVSSWAKHKPVLVATIPLGIIAFLEFYFYKTHIFASAVKDRVLGWVLPIDFTTGRHLGANDGTDNKGSIYEQAATFLSLPDFWYGLAVAAMMVALAVNIRRFRNEI